MQKWAPKLPKLILLILVVSLSIGTSRAAQGFQWEDNYQERSLHGHDGSNDVDTHYTNEWVIQTRNHQTADRVARSLGYRNLGRVRGFNDIYLLRRDDTHVRSKRAADHHTRTLLGDNQVCTVPLYRKISFSTLLSQQRLLLFFLLSDEMLPFIIRKKN